MKRRPCIIRIFNEPVQPMALNINELMKRCAKEDGISWIGLREK